MRGMIEGLVSPYPLGFTLPALFQEDDFAQRFVSGLDPALAPVFTTLDCQDAYLDAQLAPEDFLEWIAGWLGIELDETWPVERQRALVSRMVELYGRRGTVTGLTELVTIYTGAEPEIEDNGGAAWSPVPGGELPGSPEAKLRVRARATQADAKRVRALVAAGTPAHVVTEVEVVDP
jgi:phage tail-like protein